MTVSAFEIPWLNFTEDRINQRLSDYQALS